VAWLQEGWCYSFWDGWNYDNLVVQRLYNYNWYNCDRCSRRIRHGQLYGNSTGTLVDDNNGDGFGNNDNRFYPEIRYCINCASMVADTNSPSYQYY
jgi:hypothetical protein